MMTSFSVFVDRAISHFNFNECMTVSIRRAFRDNGKHQYQFLELWRKKPTHGSLSIISMRRSQLEGCLIGSNGGADSRKMLTTSTETGSRMSHGESFQGWVVTPSGFVLSRSVSSISRLPCSQLIVPLAIVRGSVVPHGGYRSMNHPAVHITVTLTPYQELATGIGSKLTSTFKFKCTLFQGISLLSLFASHAMSDWKTTGALVLGSVVVLYLGRRVFGSRDTYPLPPGPPGLPWVGNIAGVDTDAPWKTYAEWAKTYGRLQHVHFHN